MEDYDDGAWASSPSKTYLGSRKIEEDAWSCFRLYMFYQGQQLTAEILYFKSMEAF
jgi:hypothetical protein